MLQAQESSVKNAPVEGPEARFTLTFTDILFRGAVLLVAVLAVTNIALAYIDAHDQQQRVEVLEEQLADVEHRNERLRTRIEGLRGDPALAERFMRERGEMLPGEEILQGD